MAKTITTKGESSSSTTSSRSQSQSQGKTLSQSTTSKFLDEGLLSQILSGLTGYMSDDEIRAYAENLLRPQLGANLEAAQHQYETTELTKKQEIENLAASLARSIAEQQGAYARSMQDLQAGALARGMGRSSYALEAMAGQGRALAQTVQGLTEENARRTEQIRQQITQAAQQNAKTQSRLNTDYAAALAAKAQELRREQMQEYNRSYLTAVSGSLGQRTQGEQKTNSSTVTNTTGRTTGSSQSVSVTRRA